MNISSIKEPPEISSWKQFRGSWLRFAGQLLNDVYDS